MKLKIIHPIGIICVIGLLLMTSCLEINEPGMTPSCDEMSVATFVGPQTKDPIDGTTLPADRTLKMSAYWNAPSGRGTSANYFSNVTFSEDASGTNKWRGGTKSGSTFTSAPRYWPQTGTLDLFAYSANGLACGAVSGTQTYMAKVADGVTLSIEDNNATQTDILFGRVAAATKADGGNAMTLRHAQALLVWTAESNVAYDATTNYGITLNAIKLEEAYFSGTLAIDGTAAAGSNCTWTNLGNKAASRTLGTTDAAATKIPYHVPATAVAVTTSGWHLGLGGKGIMVPEQAATRFYVEYTIHNGKNDAGTNIDNNVTALYTCSGTWDEGKKYIYKIHFNQNEIIVVPSVVDWEDGGTEIVYIPPVPPVDLSLKTYSGADSPTRNTANCYVVREAGTYDIPLVYGNGIKAGATNAPAYTRQVSDYTADFVNHLGNTLTSPYIEENAGCTASEAGLLWQTNAGMVTEVSLADDSPCRKLRVKVEDIPADNGIAVVYVKDTSGNIMWSWTLWMTTDNLEPETITNYQGVNYQMMPEGLCTIWDAGRTRCRNAYYQWGRKDPMPPSAAYNSTSNCTLYTITGSTYSGFGNYGTANNSDAGGTVRSVANAIRMPEKFFLPYSTTSNSWNNLPWMNNFWNAAMTADASIADDQASAIKTLYDPCPAGWMLPSGRAWTGFTTTGDYASSSSQLNVIGSFANGCTFKKTAVDAVGTYYPASGCRSRVAGGLNDVGSYGYWWSYAPHSRAYASYLRFSSGSVNPLYSDSRAYGFSVRPCVEP